MRFRTHPDASPDGKVWDCRISPAGVLDGESVDHEAHQLEVVNTVFEPGVYRELSSLLDELEDEGLNEEEVAMVLMRLDESTRTYWEFALASKYHCHSPQAWVWALVDQLRGY